MGRFHRQRPQTCNRGCATPPGRRVSLGRHFGWRSAHAHPSGDPTPSAQDIAATRQLVEAGKIIGIEVLDHVVLGARTETRLKDFVSFRQENLL